MSDPYDRFEAEVTRLTREAVFASPGLREASRRRRRRRLWLTVASCIMAPLLLAAALFVLPVSVFSPAFLLLAPEFIETERPVPRADADTVLAAHSVVIAAIVCLAFGRPGSLFCSPRYLMLAGFYPVSDRSMLRRALADWQGGLAYFTYAVLLLYGAIAWRDGLTWDQIGAMGVLAIFQAWHLMSLAVIAAHRLPTIGWVSGVGAIVALMLFAGAIYPMHLVATYPQHQGWAALVALLTPTGWINGALSYGVLEGHFAGYFFLAPVAVTSAYAIWWLRRGYAIREIRVSSQGELTPVFEYGLPNPRPKDDSPPALACNAPREGHESIQAIEKRLLASPELAPPDWRDCWFLERWIGDLLTDRERTVLEQFYNSPPRWTVAWLTFAVAWFVFLIIVVGAFSPERDWTDFQPSGALMLFPLLMVAMEFCLYIPGRNSEMRTTPPLHPIFPVGLHETFAALKKTLALRAIFYLPFLVVAALAETWWRPVGWLYASAIVLVIAIQMVAAYLVVARMGFSMLNRYRFHWRRCVALTAIALAGFLALPMSMVVHPIVSPALALLVLLLAYLGCRQFDRLYVDTEFDFTMPIPMTPIRPNQPRVQGW